MMKELTKELRLWLAEKLMGWASSVAPKCKEGERIRQNIYNHFIKIPVKQRTKSISEYTYLEASAELDEIKKRYKELHEYLLKCESALGRRT